MIDLTVILPLYNGEQFLSDAILSVEENNKDLSIEILIVDDGSTDNSLSVAQSLSNEYSNIVVFSKQNGGIASAREYGFKKSNGKYITFLDQDDKVLSGYSSFIKRMEDEQADMLMTDYSILHEGAIIKTSIIKEERIYEHIDCLDMGKMLFCPQVFTPADAESRHLINVTSSVWNCIFQKQFITSNNLHFEKNLRYEDDWLFIGQSLGCCSRLIVTTKGYYCWTINSKSESHTTKYIENYFHKRQKHKTLLLGIVSKMADVKESEMHDFEHILDAQTVIVCGKNSLLLPLKDYLSEIKQLKSFGELSQYYDFKVSRLSSLYIRLWGMGLYVLAYFVNSIIKLLKNG